MYCLPIFTCIPNEVSIVAAEAYRKLCFCFGKTDLITDLFLSCVLLGQIKV